MLLLNVSEVLVLLPSKRESLPLKAGLNNFTRSDTVILSVRKANGLEDELFILGGHVFGCYVSFGKLVYECVCE